ncbi:DUF4136 domain-containing protein [Siphonobacter sp. SORGH_AS_0500]|uniref:DUF4136 domain-containing protein n=1 Tax=Siphonobacter sp. SORGH_AS_0500 TaxID=1864824 RepID=UPI00285650DC|nr:DUF4136 domain-containing protein [Siphonobacter sp. SORGH_AS_0500]MDR6196822.1 hypothetical protein [Siphonobacter sp. SORGH_AS_0500]
MKRISKSLLLLVCSVGLLAACERDPVNDLDPKDSQVFITNHATTNFTGYKTFSIPDSVLVVENEKSTKMVRTQDLIFIDRIITNLTNRGFTRVAHNAKPDLEVTPAQISYSQSGYVPTYNPWYYDPYWGYGNGYGYGYGYGYAPYYSYYSYSENYWYIRIADVKNVSNNQATVVWDAQIRGDGIYDTSSVGTVVDGVFAQSTYLKAN